MFNKRRISLGEGFVDRWTLFENKRFGGVYFHSWNTIRQDRFHTHAFNGWAWLISGGYEEEEMVNDQIFLKSIKPGIRYIPKEYNHRILKSQPHTYSLLVAGPWSKTWTEETDKWKSVLGWNRNVIEKTWK